MPHRGHQVWGRSKKGVSIQNIIQNNLNGQEHDHRGLNLAPFATNQGAYAAFHNKQDIDHDIKFQPDGGNLFSSFESELDKPNSISGKPASKLVKGAKKVTLKPTPNPAPIATPNPVLIRTPVPSPAPTPYEALQFSLTVTLAAMPSLSQTP
jgi:hypothetical protein